MNGHTDIVDFEDDNYDKLVENFLKKHHDIWEHFVIDEYASECHRVAEAIAEGNNDR